MTGKMGAETIKDEEYGDSFIDTAFGDEDEDATGEMNRL